MKGPSAEGRAGLRVDHPHHYVAYRPRPFAASERRDVTVLLGGLTWKHERLVRAVFENMGYRAELLPNVARPDLEAGKELIDVGACCPTTFTTGNLVRFLRSRVEQEGRREVERKYVFLTAGACGPCRFGQYRESYSLALEGIGLREFRVFLMEQAQLDQGPTPGGGLEVDLPFSLGLVWAILCADLLTDLEYRTRPYEVVAGQTDRVLARSIDTLCRVFRDRPRLGGRIAPLTWHVLTGYFSRALRDEARRWDEIEVDRLRVKCRVKITGEFWLQTHEGDGNYDIKRWLEREGAEVVPPPVAVWLDYLMHLSLRQLAGRTSRDPRARRKRRLVRVLDCLYHWSYRRLRAALGGLPAALPDQGELARLAAPYYHYRIHGGEGHMLVGKAIHAHLHKHAHMVCELSPYGCLPNTMSVGAMSNVLGQYPDLLYAPIEVKGDAEVHALSRCQLVLTEAKRRAQQEMAEAEAQTGLSLEEARRRARGHPGVRSAMWLVPQAGCAGTAASTLRYLAAR
jgi:predicted nucleotide-binding protein (sugar kinase/HSP70/actin superfamily)